MEGRGVVNYNADKPSHSFSTRTTEFDDQLIQRGIISYEEAMMRKGASANEALRLKEEKERNPVGEPAPKAVSNDDQASDDEEGDDFLARHRQTRLHQLKESSRRNRFGEVHIIARPEWTKEVNEDSETAWVAVNLTSSDSERTGCVESAVAMLARKFADVKFVNIASHSAIPNWPDEQLPTIFLYRNGKMQHQLVQLPVDISEMQLEWKLAQLGVLETELEEDPTEAPGNSRLNGYRGTTFGGIGSQLMTKDLAENYDEVD